MDGRPQSRCELHTLDLPEENHRKLVNIPPTPVRYLGVVNHLNRRFSLIAGHQSFCHFRLEQRLGNPYSNKEQGKSGQYTDDRRVGLCWN